MKHVGSIGLRRPLGHLIALRVATVNEQDHAQVGLLAADDQAATGNHVGVAYVDQGYTVPNPHGKLPRTA